MSFFNKSNNKTEKVNPKRRKRLIIFLVIITLLSMTTSTVAWFTVNTFVGVDSLDLHISVAAQLKVSMEDHGTNLDEYVKTITNEMIDSYLAKQNTKLEDIVLDPVTTREGTEFVGKTGDRREPNDTSYLEFECYFIATKDMWVHLTTEKAERTPSYEGNDGTYVSTESTGAKADVVNCVRVDFTTEGNDTAIWEPNRGTPVNGQTTFDIPNPMSYTDNSRLFHLKEMTPTKATIRLWVDGEDPQCDDDVQEAQLTVALAFVGTDDNNVPIS